MGQNDLFVGGKHLDGLGHETHAAHQHILLRDIHRFAAERKGIADKVGDLHDIMTLVVMC